MIAINSFLMVCEIKALKRQYFLELISPTCCICFFLDFKNQGPVLRAFSMSMQSLCNSLRHYNSHQTWIQKKKMWPQRPEVQNGCFKGKSQKKNRKNCLELFACLLFTGSQGLAKILTEVWRANAFVLKPIPHNAPHRLHLTYIVISSNS